MRYLRPTIVHRNHHGHPSAVLPASRVRDSWRLKQNCNSPRPTTRAHQAAIQVGQRQVRTTGPNQGLKVQFARVIAFALGLHALALTPCAARSDAPTCSECVSEGFHDHENIMGTLGAAGNLFPNEKGRSEGQLRRRLNAGASGFYFAPCLAAVLSDARGLAPSVAHNATQPTVG